MALTYEQAMEHANLLRTTGRWWESGWWRLPGALYDEATVETFAASVEILRVVFDDHWLLGAGHHPFAQELRDTGACGIRRVLEVAAYVQAVRSAQGDATAVAHVLERLKNPAEWRGARREAFAALLLQRSDLSYRFLSPTDGASGNRRSDIETLSGDPRFYVEVTGFDQRDQEERLHELVHVASRVLQAELPEFGCETVVDGPEIEALAELEGDRFVVEAKNLLSRVRKAAVDARGGTPGDVLEVPGVLRATLTETPNQGSACGPVISTEAWTRKSVGVVESKYKQLPPDRPGVVFVEFPVARVDPDSVRTRLAERLSGWSPPLPHLAGAIFVTRWDTADASNTDLYGIDNPTATVPLSRLPWRFDGDHGNHE